MNFVEGGVDGGDEPSEESPGPVPGAAILASGPNAVIDEEEENEVLDEMRGFADEMMGELEAVRSDEGEEPAKERLEDKASVVGRKEIRGEEEDKGSPEKGWPPGAKPSGNGRG